MKFMNYEMSNSNWSLFECQFKTQTTKLRHFADPSHISTSNPKPKDESFWPHPKSDCDKKKRLFNDIDSSIPKNKNDEKNISKK